MRGGLEALHFKMIYPDRKSKVTNEMKLIKSAKPLVITNGHTNSQKNPKQGNKEEQKNKKQSV